MVHTAEPMNSDLALRRSRHAGEGKGFYGGLKIAMSRLLRGQDIQALFQGTEAKPGSLNLDLLLKPQMTPVK